MIVLCGSCPLRPPALGSRMIVLCGSCPLRPPALRPPASAAFLPHAVVLSNEEAFQLRCMGCQILPRACRGPLLPPLPRGHMGRIPTSLPHGFFHLFYESPRVLRESSGRLLLLIHHPVLTPVP